MSIKHSLLALLNEAPAYGYQLKTAFEERTAGAYPLNIGQVYTTLTRCERDGLITQTGVDSDNRITYALTAAGRQEVTAWFSEPVGVSETDRDELAIKIALAVASEQTKVRDIITTQRSETMHTLQQLTRRKAKATTPHDLALLLVLDKRIYEVEAELRWLDLCESRITSTSPSKKR